jgi:2-desacetyl-2-hydroxyethyl bacteriochlorophyllide A dehydrogenase
MEKSYPMAFVTRPGKIEYLEKKVPEIQGGQVLIRTKAVGICGGDLHILKGKHPGAPLPMALGHELAGEIIQVGRDVRKWKEGDRVTVEPIVFCGKCYFCSRGLYSMCTTVSFQYRKGQGAFAPYFIIEEDRLHKLPPGVSFEEGALFEPLAVALHAVEKGGLQLGQTVAILGAGPIGLLILLLSKMAGIVETFVVDIKDYRLQKAKELGALEIYNNRQGDALKKIGEKTAHLGVDRAFEVVGVQETLVQSLEVLKKGGMAMIVGIFEDDKITIPVNQILSKEIHVVGCLGYCWNFQTALKLVELGGLKLKSLISHTFPLSSLQEAFDLLLDPQNEALKVVIKIE